MYVYGIHLGPKGFRVQGLGFRAKGFLYTYCNPRSPGTHIVGPWVTDSIKSYRVLRTGTQYIGNWASRVRPEHMSHSLNS